MFARFASDASAVSARAAPELSDEDDGLAAEAIRVSASLSKTAG
jgi:hypothetical protein